MRTVFGHSVGLLLASTAVLSAPTFKVCPFLASLSPSPHLADLLFSPQRDNSIRRRGSASSSSSISYNYTTVSDAPTVTAPTGNPWKELSFDEAEGVVSFLYTQLNLTAAADAGAWDNVIQTIDLAVPNKSVRLLLFFPPPARWKS